MSTFNSVAPGSHRLDQLYAEHHGWLKTWLRGRMGHAADAADLAQDTFLRVLGSGQTLPADQPRAYLTRVARNLLIDLHRRRLIERAYLEALTALPEPQAPCLETQYLIVEALLRIDALLRALPVATREIFLASQLDGLTYQQIANARGVSLTTVKRHVHRALVACMAAA